MGEAVITRGGIGGGNIGVSNETKNSLGLNNNATMDDIISTLAFKDPSMASVIVTVKSPVGTPIPNATVKMTPVEGAVLEYKCNNQGQCLFKTNAGQYNIQETNANGYIDIIPAALNNQPAVVGQVYQIDLTREGMTSVNLNKNQNIKFSSDIESVDVFVSGSGGGGGSGYVNVYGANRYAIAFYANDTTSYADIVDWTGINRYYGASGGAGYTNSLKSFKPDINRNYNIAIYPGGSGGLNLGKSTQGSSAKGWAYSNIKYRFAPTSSPLGSNGDSGGSVMFDNVLSATGGKGGIAAKEQGSSSVGGDGYTGNGASGGSYGYGKINLNCFVYEYWANCIATSWCSGGSSGSSGYVILNNFTYK